MKKIAKLSLVAAVAVAGLTNVNAASLEEAIKGVDVSGQFRFRAEERSSDYTATGKTASGTKSDVEIEVGVKVPVNDKVTAVFKIDNANDDFDNDTPTKGDVEIEDYYFSYADGALTVNAGQQNIPGRLTDGRQGDGIVALYNLGAATVGAASFMNTNVASGANLNSVIAMGNVGPVSLLAQYADASDVADAYNVKADAKLGPATIGVEYSETDFDANSEERETLKAYISGKVSMLSATVAYASTGKDGSGSILQEAEAASELLLWQVGSAGVADLDAFVIDASLAVNDKVSIRAAYLDGEHGTTDADVSETLGQVSYKMSKNLNAYVRYSVREDQGAADTDRGRVEVRYSF